MRELQHHLVIDVLLSHHRFPDGPVERQVPIEHPFGGGTGTCQAHAFLAPARYLLRAGDRLGHEGQDLIERRVDVDGVDAGVARRDIDDGLLGHTQSLEQDPQGRLP